MAYSTGSSSERTANSIDGNTGAERHNTVLVLTEVPYSTVLVPHRMYRVYCMWCDGVRATGDDVRTERELPPLMVGPQVGNRLFLSDCYTHLHGGVRFEFETPDLLVGGLDAVAPVAIAGASGSDGSDVAPAPSGRKMSSARSSRLSYAGMRSSRQATPVAGDDAADGESGLGALGSEAGGRAGRPLFTDAVRDQIQLLTRKLLARMVSMSQAAAASMAGSGAPQQGNGSSSFTSPQRPTTSSTSAALKRAFQQQSEQLSAPTIELANGKMCAALYSAHVHLVCRMQNLHYCTSARSRMLEYRVLVLVCAQVLLSADRVRDVLRGRAAEALLGAAAERGARAPQEQEAADRRHAHRTLCPVLLTSHLSSRHVLYLAPTPLPSHLCFVFVLF